MLFAAHLFAKQALQLLCARPATKTTVTAGFAQMMLTQQKHRVPEKPHGQRLKH
jgi:hypothetical protein